MTNVHRIHWQNLKRRMKDRYNRECGTVPACVDHRTVKLKLLNVDLEEGETRSLHPTVGSLSAFLRVTGKGLFLESDLDLWPLTWQIYEALLLISCGI